jgi:hypothetical protein
MRQNPQLACAPLGNDSCFRRTGHPFAVSGPYGPSQMIECVFAASPETIRREPQDQGVHRSVGHIQDLAACALCDLFSVVIGSYATAVPKFSTGTNGRCPRSTASR